jgi:hypothetical protein
MADIIDKSNLLRASQIEQNFQFIRAGKFHIVIPIFNSQSNPQFPGIGQ